MALPTTKILLRSPYWITREGDELDHIFIDLTIWTGDLVADEPSSYSIRLRSTALNGKVSVDIAEFARDFVEVTYDGVSESNAVWISYQVSQYSTDPSTPILTEFKEYAVGFDGYSVFQDGINYQWYRQILLNSNSATLYPDTNFEIPILQDHLTGWKLQTLTPNTSDLYHTYHFATGLTPVENTSEVVQGINTSYQGVYADRVLFEYDNAPDEYYYLDYSPCSLHGLTVLTFVNRLGASQDLHFSGRFDVNMQAESSTYKRNILVDGNYSDTRHQQYVLNKNGNITMSLNTGWISEEENDTIIEMFMSEQIWIKVEIDKLGVGWLPKQSSNYIVPVNLKSEMTPIKNKLNDKLINYTFKFEAAHDWINTVR